MPVQMIRQQRVLGMAIVIEEADGTRVLIGVNDVHRWSWQMDQGVTPAWGPHRNWHVGPPTFCMEVEASAGFIRDATPGGALPKGLPRGIYLPDLSFHALPAPDDGEL